MQIHFLFFVVYTDECVYTDTAVYTDDSENFCSVFTVLHITEVLGLWFLDSMIIPTIICNKNRKQKISFSFSIFLKRGKQEVFIFVH